MNCERARTLVDAYTTDELELATALDVEEHLEACAGCKAELESLRGLRRVICDPSLRYRAPAALRREIAGEVDARQKFPLRRVLAIAAVVALVVLPWVWMYASGASSRSERLAQDVTASHIRSLMGEHLLDVPSTDQHTVKPWFNGKLDFSPIVVDPASEGFPLVGGRLDYVDGRTVAVLVYQRRKHVINVYTWPGTVARKTSRVNGYNVVEWSRGGMRFVAVSDLNPQELEGFAKLLGGDER